MANATVVLVGDRLHAINGVITLSGGLTLKTRRYFPQNYANSAMHPLLFPLWGRGTHAVPGAGAQQYSGTRAWELVLVVGAFEQGLPSESAQADAEIVTDAVIDAYIPRPRLELAGAPLDGVERVEWQPDSGLIPFAEDPAYACVRFPLIITTHKVFEFNTE